ncbi:MAG: 7TM diverse intracellular signaling domain-containing protein [Candidatus Thiodiazotropha taylori]
MLIFRGHNKLTIYLWFFLFFYSLQTLANESTIELSVLYWNIDSTDLTLDTINSSPNHNFSTHPPIKRKNNDVWARIVLPLELMDSAESWYLQIDFPNIDKVDVYVREAGRDNWKYYRVGDDTIYRNWPVNFRIPTIPLGMFPEPEVYARINSYGEFVFPLKIVSESTLIKQVDHSNSYYSAVFSAIFVLVVSNFFLYLFIRDSSYFYYVAYILAFSFVQLGVTGLGQQYLWPDLDGGTTIIALVAIAVTNLFLPLFSIQYLSLRKVAPKIANFMTIFAIFPLASLFLLLLDNYIFAQNTLHLLSSINMVIVLYISLKMTIGGDRSAAYMSVSYSVLFFAISLALLHQNGVIETGFLVKHMMELAIVFEALLLSIGLADRINRIRLDNIRIGIEKQEDQKHFYKTLMSVGEKERSRLARLLHDSVSHDLLLIENQIKKIQPSDEKNGLVLQVDNVIKKIRDISHLIHPFHLEQLGFSRAAERLIQKTFNDSPIECMAAIENTELPRNIENELFYSLQECLNNIIKHSNATEVMIRFYIDKAKSCKQAILLVKDDGSGFCDHTNEAGFGLRMIKDSIENLGGFILLESSDGTEVKISLPLAEYN